MCEQVGCESCLGILGSMLIGSARPNDEIDKSLPHPFMAPWHLETITTTTNATSRDETIVSRVRLHM